MSWVWLDDGFDEHPKFVHAMELGGDAALSLWVRSLAYCNRRLTDGFVPAGMVRRLTHSESPDALASNLVAAGLWRADSERGGYVLHDYHAYQPTRTEVEKRREERSKQKSDAGRKGGKAKAKQTPSRRAADGWQEAGGDLANRSPSPSPSPSPTSQERFETSQSREDLTGDLRGPSRLAAADAGKAFGGES